MIDTRFRRCILYNRSDRSIGSFCPEAVPERGRLLASE
jgi:hypothetical protein